MKLVVIYNPTSGRKRAARRVERLRRSLGKKVEFWPTLHAGHGEELASQAAQAGFEVIGAAGGDGTVHEVANGILRAARPEVCLGVFPFGSANDYAHSLNFSSTNEPATDSNKGFRMVDVGVVQGEKGQRFFVNSLGLGFPGMVTIEARRIPWLRGLPLYGLAFVRALLFRYACPQMVVALDGVPRKGPTFSLNLAIGRREGNMVIAPLAQMADGLFDFMHVGALSRGAVLRFLPHLASGKPLPSDYPGIWLGRCREAVVVSETPLIVHLDGEFFCLPEDKERHLKIDILASRLRVRTFAPEQPFEE